MAEVIRIRELAPQSDIDGAVKAFIAYCVSRNLSGRTVEFYTERLASFTNYMAQHAPGQSTRDVTPTLIRSYLTATKKSSSAATANHNLNALRVFYRFLVSEELAETNPALLVEKMRTPKRVIQPLATEQIEAILATCSRDFYGTRDRALILLLLDTGMRVSELTGLRVEDVSLERQTATVFGKGSKERQVPFGASVRSAITSYLIRRGEIGRNRLLFVNHYGEALTRFSVRDMLYRRGEDAGIEGARLSPHTFRHTFAREWLINGGDAFSLQRMLGHTTMEMVRNYVNLVSSDVSAIHRNASPADRMQNSKKTGRKRLR